MNLCAFDIGTVTARMLACTYVDGSLTTVARRTSIVNLGEGVDATGFLKVEAMERVRDTLQGYLDELARLWPGETYQLRAVGTSASRDAKNSQEFIDMLADIGVTLEIIPGDTEAALSFAGASAAFKNEDVLVCDVGGGSTELISGIGGQTPDASHSFDIGCRRVTERFLKSDPPTPEELTRARVWVRSELENYLHLFATDEAGDSTCKIGDASHRTGNASLKTKDTSRKTDDAPYKTNDASHKTENSAPAVPDAPTPTRPLIAVAGTATTVASVHMQMATYDSERVHLSHITPDILDEVFDQLAHMTLDERRHVVGLQPERASVIVAGLLILQEVVAATKSFGFIVSESDILLGIIGTLL